MLLVTLLQTVGLAAIMFAATNVDDLALLALFFAQPNCRPRAIVLGQLAGIGALTAISYTAASLAVAVPHGWLPWIGVVPVYLGLRWLWQQKDDEPAPVAGTWWAVAGITMANGGDNLGVYIPVFALQSGIEKVITGLTFLGFTLVWCWVARMIVQHPAWGPLLSRVCGRAAPFVLIGLGLWIIAHHPVFGLGLAM